VPVIIVSDHRVWIPVPVVLDCIFDERQGLPLARCLYFHVEVEETLDPWQSRHEIWSLRHPLRQMPHGKILRIVLGAEATIVSSPDGWKKTNESQMHHQSDLNLWFSDFATAELPRDSVFAFTIRWKHDQRWEGRNWQVSML
jgi:hypothetical protein